MAIRDIVTRGFGNGTYDPGVSDAVTRGYTIGAVAVVGDGVGTHTRHKPRSRYTRHKTRSRYSRARSK